MDVFEISLVVLAALGILGLCYYLGCGTFGYFKLREYAKVFPNRPFPIAWRKNKAEPVFVLPQHSFKFELKRGTKRNGLYGVIEVSLTSAERYKDGTNMVKLLKSVDTLVQYLRNQGYEVKDDYGTLRDLKDAVSKIDTLEYLDTPESQVE